MLTLYGVYRSRASRPLWLLHECGAPFRHVPVIQAYRLADPHAPDAPSNTASPEFLRINPQGQIPAMTEDDLLLTESLAIALHIARRHGGALGPADAAEDARMVNWALAAATGIEPHAIAILYTHAEGRAETTEGRAGIAAARAALERPLGRIEAHLEGRDWLEGGRFTVADIMVAECLRYAQPEAGVFDATPRLADWIARCQARDGFAAMMAGRAAEPA
ncbi:MAG: glutathione S-transferase family protein [Gemmobacter sp.]